MDARVTSGRSQVGQVSAELVAATGLLLLLGLIVAQAAVVGYALWSAGEAARAGARAAHVDGGVEAAARSALPEWLERDAEIDTAGPVQVRLSAPALVPGAPAIGVRAATSLGPDGPDG